jgi:hypothetical protein
MVAVLVSDSIETSATDDLFFESLVEIESFFASDENVDDFDVGEGVKEFFEENFTEEASGACNEDGFASVLIDNCHMKLNEFIIKILVDKGE